MPIPSTGKARKLYRLLNSDESSRSILLCAGTCELLVRERLAVHFRYWLSYRLHGETFVKTSSGDLLRDPAPIFKRTPSKSRRGNDGLCLFLRRAQLLVQMFANTLKFLCTLCTLFFDFHARTHVVFVFSFSSFFSFYLFISFLLTNRPKTTRFPTFESCPFKCVSRFMFFARRYKTLALITEIFFFNSVLLECAANVCILLESVQFLSWRICFRSPLLFFPFLNVNIHFENSTFLRRPLFTFTRETLSSRKLAIFIRGFTL